MAGAEIDGGASTAAQNTGLDGVKAGTGTLTRDTSVFRSGAASWKFDSTASNLAISVSPPTPTFVTATSYFLRAYFLIGANIALNLRPILALGGSSTNQEITAVLQADGTVFLQVSGARQGSFSSVITADGIWHRIELKGTVTSTNWTAAELQIDGVSIATWSGTQAFTNGANWGWFLSAPGANKTMNVDDVALNDSTGATNNTWCGDGAVVLLVPTADSAKGTGWTNDAAGTTNFFNATKNTPPTGIADTTGGSGLHQIRNATSNANSNYDATMTTYTAAGAGTGATVNAVLPVTATAAPVTTSSKQGTVGVVSNPAITNIALGATGTAGAFWSGLAGGTYGAGWKWSLGTMTQTPTVTLGTAPVMRITQVTSSTRIADVCFMGMYVDYTPAASGTTYTKAGFGKESA
jgi:hypothetical protein